MEITPTQGCCGLYELHGFDDDVPSGSKLLDFMQIYEQEYGHRGQLAFLLFTDALGNTSGKRLAKYIQNKQLGTLIETDKKENPKSRHLIKCWIWDIDWKALRSWAKNR